MTKLVRVIVAVLAAALATFGVQLVAPAALACGPGQNCPAGVASKGDGDRGTGYGSYGGCTVHANPSAVGSYCLTGGGVLKSLKEMFPGQVLQRCRYREFPEHLPQPFNSRPDEGRYMLLMCVGNINLNTHTGGKDRTLDMYPIWVAFGTPTDDQHNGITDFIWNQMEKTVYLPVPFLKAQPNVTPIVGVPTFFTFKWVDPTTKQAVREGPYADKPDGGPFRRMVTGNGVVIEAKAVDLVVDPNQEDVKGIHCAVDTPYTVGAAPSQQPAEACSITFPRSSASAEKYSKVPFPSQVDKHAFYTNVDVKWSVRYGRPGDWRDLGTFRMRLFQSIPVQEVQAPNQPPFVIY